MIDVALHAEQIAIALLGSPNEKLSSDKELRFGRKGSLCIDLSKGTFYDHENEEGGGMLSLIQRERGESSITEFLETLGITEQKLPPVRNNDTQIQSKEYSSDEMRALAEKAEIYSRFNDAFCTMRFEGKIYRPFSRVDSNNWIMKRPTGLMPLLLSEGDSAKPVIVVEGEKAFLGAKELAKENIICAWHGGVSALEQSNWTQLKDFNEVIIFPDNDDAGFDCAIALKEKLESLNIKTSIVKPPTHWDEKDDLYDAYERQEYFDVVKYARDNEYHKEASHTVVYHDYKAFKDIEYPPKVWLIENLMARSNLFMIHGAPGHCKSLGTSVMSIALASGYNFGHYKIPNAVKVVYIDAEMPPNAMQERLNQQLNMFSAESFERQKELIQRVEKNLFIVSHHDQEHGLLPLNTEEGKTWFWDMIEKIDPAVVILDNLLTLTSMTDSNQADEWVSDVQPLLLKLRQQDRVAWFVHHSSKAGTQLGSMSKTVVLDGVIKTELANNDSDALLDIDAETYETSFKWSFEKTRHFYGKDALPIAWLYSNGVMSKDKDDLEMRREVVAQMINEGADKDAISSKTGVSVRTIERDIAYAKSNKMIDEEPPF
tara:strand:- start:7582 stop:9381 length:1800 start_codon:yes stop_codon:yes gene_type:complete